MAAVATASDWQNLLHVTPPDNAEYLLALATEDVDDLIVGAVFDTVAGLPADPDLLAALKLATVVQAVFLADGKDPSGGAAAIQEVTVGGVRYTRAARGDRPGRYSPRAQGILQRAGLIPVAPYHR